MKIGNVVKIGNVLSRGNVLRKDNWDNSLNQSIFAL